MIIVAYAEADERIRINDQTFLVSRRYYFIARLDKTIKLLAKFSHDAKRLPRMCGSQELLDYKGLMQECQFHHDLVKDSVASMCQTRSLKPLFMVWDAFKSYKSLKDDLFVEDFSKEIFIITRAIAHQIQPEEHIKSLPIDHDVVCRCDAISQLSEYIAQHVYGQDAYLPLQERVTDVSDLALNIHTDQVACRYYLLHRLYQASQLIMQMRPEVQEMMREAAMAITHRVGYSKATHKRTFAQLWDDCLQYKFINDQEFLHAFTVDLFLMLHIYQQQYELAAPSERKPLNYVQLMQIYQQINKIPLEEILTGIDFLVTNALAISNNYQKSGLSFTQWAAQYWWAPPVIMATVIFQCVKFYYKKYYPR
jgi:hypothetical protein